MGFTGFSEERLSDAQIAELDALRSQCAGEVIRMTTLAASGHPGGSLSSLDALLVLYGGIRYDPNRPRDPGRDRVIISHGHISPASYSVLVAHGFLDREEVLLNFRRAGTPFSGHVESCVSGVEWNTGNLGQGLSVGVAAALAAKLQGRDTRVCVCMGDGEQQKGQIAEARRFAIKYGLDNVFAIVDLNRLQIGGEIAKIMPQEIEATWRAEGWNVIDVADGHDWHQLYSAIKNAYLKRTDRPDRPSVVIAHTVMGKGVSFMENDHGYHGAPVKGDKAVQALAELGVANDLEALAARRRELPALVGPQERRKAPPTPRVELETGAPRILGVDAKTDCRSAYGHALADLAALNNTDAAIKVAGFSCDLQGSVKMDLLEKVSPGAFFEGGIQEHNTAVVSGALSREGIRTFFSTFGVFGVAEVYNQHRISDINETQLKLVCTHCGIDVGEDGPTHQSIDYLGLIASLFHFEIFAPADPNQCDRIIRAIATRDENSFVPMGRSKQPVIAKEDGDSPFFDERYVFVPGRADRLRSGGDAAIIAFGTTVWRALEAHELLKQRGLNVEVWNMASLKPLDRDAVLRAAETGLIVTYEDHNVHTGLGSMVGNVLAEERVVCRLEKKGVTFYSSSGTASDLFAEQGLQPQDVAACVESALEDRGNTRPSSNEPVAAGNG